MITFPGCNHKLNALKAKRDNAKVVACLNKIKEYATNDRNLMTVVMDGVENFCTLGEIFDALRSVFGEDK